MNHNAPIFVAGHLGLAGSAIVRKLKAAGYTDLLLRTRQELDLTDRRAVANFYAREKPQYVIVAAAKVGGILANNMYPADFIRENLFIALNLIDASQQHDVDKLLFLSSSCVYPKHAPQPMREEYVLTGALEPTNEPYAVAKIAAMKLCESYHRQFNSHFFSALPTNLYGPHDNFDLQTSHVLPALIHKFHDAKVQGSDYVTVWGTGRPRREFMHVDDLADACLFLMESYEASDPLNIGVGEDLTIAELAAVIAEVVDYQGEVRFDPSKPDGTPQKLLDVTRISALGWKAQTPLRTGIAATYEWFLQHTLPSAIKAY